MRRSWNRRSRPSLKFSVQAIEDGRQVVRHSMFHRRLKGGADSARRQRRSQRPVLAAVNPYVQSQRQPNYR